MLYNEDKPTLNPTPISNTVPHLSYLVWRTVMSGTVQGFKASRMQMMNISQPYQVLHIIIMVVHPDDSIRID